MNGGHEGLSFQSLASIADATNGLFFAHISSTAIPLARVRIAVTNR